MIYGVMSYLAVDEKVLMIKKYVRENDPNSGLYTLSGGKLEEYEKGGNPLGRLEASLREPSQETGLTLISPKLKGVILFDNNGRTFDNWKNPQDFLVYLFESKNYSGILKEECDEGVPLWVAEKDIPGLPKNSGDSKIYEWLKDSRYFMGVIRHKGKELDEKGTFVDYY